MRVLHVALHHLRLPLVVPWVTPTGTLNDREVLLVELHTDIGVGWGECAAFAADFYSPETIGTSRVAIESMSSRLVAAGDVTPESVSVIAGGSSARMALSAVEMAVLDADLRHRGLSFAEFLGVRRRAVPAGVAVGLSETSTDLLAKVEPFVEQGYTRVKVKIEPGRDVEFVGALRAEWPSLDIVADANGSYAQLSDDDRISTLSALDEFELVCVEQPLGAEDLDGHADLATHIDTPICLDESLRSLGDVRRAVECGACSVVNLKAGRVGGYLEATRIHDFCRDANVGLWIGGMLETGLARAANVSLAALDGFTITGDLSTSARFYEIDIATPAVTLDNGHISVPEGLGFGVDIDLEALKRFSLPGRGEV